MSDVTFFTLSRGEVDALKDLTEQFISMLAESTPTDDPAVARLVPAAYADKDEAAEFRRLTEDDLLSRRADDARVLVATLRTGADEASPLSATEIVDIPLAAEEREAWLRTLTALRLVIASRLGVTDTDTHDDDDPRFGVYDWLGYRLDGLVQVADSADEATASE